MKTKLWIAWGIVGATAILSSVTGGPQIVSYGLAFIAAGFGWVCYFKYY